MDSNEELSYQRLTPEARVLFDAAKLLEISNLENSNAISIVEDARELDRIRREHPGRIMPSRFIFTKKAAEVGEGWKAKRGGSYLGIETQMQHGWSATHRCHHQQR